MLVSVGDEKVTYRLMEFLFPSIGYTKKIETDSRALANKLCPQSFARALLLEEFIEFFKVTKIFKPQDINVAVIGGSVQEPELEVFQQMGVNVNLTIFGIDPQVKFLDLNVSNPKTVKINFDLILCSQVLEHVWNHASAFESLKNLMSETTYLWISCPSSNRPHALSFYYSAGLTRSFLVNNLNFHGLKVLASGSIGTRRLYRAIHTQPSWLSVKGHKFPPLWSFEEHPYDKESRTYRTIFRIRYLFRNLELLLLSKKITSDIRCATESWACVKL